jgi:hypothetical protein
MPYISVLRQFSLSVKSILLMRTAQTRAFELPTDMSRAYVLVEVSSTLAVKIAMRTIKFRIMCCKVMIRSFLTSKHFAAILIRVTKCERMVRTGQVCFELGFVRE